MLNKNLLLLPVFLLFGCATSSQTYLPDGRVGYSINCSGSGLNMGMCYEKAADICKTQGYDIIHQSEKNQGYIINGNAFSNGYGNTYVNSYYGQSNYQFGSQSNLFSTPLINRTLIIACKSPNKKDITISNNNNDNSEVIFDKSI